MKHIYLVLLLLSIPLLAHAQQVFPSRGSTGTANIACVGTPGNTTGAYLSLCQTSAGALYSCNNTLGCTLAADWIPQAGGNLSYTGTLTVSAIMAAADSTHVYNPNASATISSAGLFSSPGGMNLGVGSGVAGSWSVTDLNAHTFTIAAGTSMTASWSISPGATVIPIHHIPICVTSGINCQLSDSGISASAAGTAPFAGYMFNGWCIGAFGTAASTEYYLVPFNLTSNACSATNVAGLPAPLACTAYQLYATTAAGGKDSGSGVFTVYVGGSASALTCTVGTGTSCNDTSHTVTVTAGQSIYIGVSSDAASDTITSPRASFLCH